MTNVDQALEQARENGRKAGIARNQHDESRARHFTEYQSRYVSAQLLEARKSLVDAFNEAYTNVRTIGY